MKKNTDFLVFHWNWDVSLPWLLRKPSRPSLILTKFLGKKLQFKLDRFRVSNFLPIPVLLQKAKKKRSRKIMFFSVSLELRCVFGFWESYPDCLWFVPNFLERSFNLIWTVSDFQSFTDSSFAEVFWQSTLSLFLQRFFILKVQRYPYQQRSADKFSDKISFK